MARPYTLDAADRRLSLWYMGIGFAHLAVGVLMGLLQVLQHAGISLYRYLPLVRHYYQGLSIHGVFNVLIFTTLFIMGFLSFITAYSLERPLVRGLSRVTFWIVLVGVALTDWALLSGKASVLYTSYAPLKAHPAYYIGLALVVVGTLLLWLNLVLTYRAWRREHPGERTPLLTFGSLVTMTMWGLSTVGLVVEFVFFLIPWSLGLTEGIDPIVTRTLFWFTGHPIVYFWLLPAYISWYFMVPKQVGGKLFSEPLARLSFLLFIPLSLPVGLHHQFLDPGVATGWKTLHFFLTFAVFMPSAMTAFTVMASIEHGGRARGGRGLLGWIRTLPWDDPSVAAQLLAMILFMFGGISGLVNGSYTLNLSVHNTLFVPGHFHLTVGSAVALTFMAVSYWLVPHLTGRRLWSRRLGVWQGWLWFAGMMLLSRGMSWAGLLGAPRRTALGSAPYFLPEWSPPINLSAVGGTLLTISAILFFVNLVATLWLAPKAAEPVPVPVAEALEEEGNIPGYLDRLLPWGAAGVILQVVSYGPVLVSLLSQMRPEFPGASPF